MQSHRITRLTICVGILMSAAASLCPAQEAVQARMVDPFRTVPTLQEMQASLADVLLDAGALPPEAVLSAQDQRAVEMMKKLHGVSPRTRLPSPALPPQVARYLNAELAAQGLPCSVRLRLPPGDEETVALRHEGVLYYGMPHAGRDSALATGTLGLILTALAASLDATLLWCKDGRVVVEPADRGEHPLGMTRAEAEIKRDFADVLFFTTGEIDTDLVVAKDDARAVEMREKLGTARPRTRLPHPALLSQIIRHLDQELARQKLPWHVRFQVNPEGEAASYLDHKLYHQYFRSLVLETGSLADILFEFERSFNATVTLCKDGTIVVQDRT